MVRLNVRKLMKSRLIVAVGKDAAGKWIGKVARIPVSKRGENHDAKLSAGFARWPFERSRSGLRMESRCRRLANFCLMLSRDRKRNK